MESTFPRSLADALLTEYQSRCANFETSSQVPTERGIGIRVVGAFSAGKSRLLSALIKESCPPRLLPVSSLKRQTALPLIIKYHAEAELHGVDAQGKRTPLDNFPRREELEGRDWIELELGIPAPALISKNQEGKLTSYCLIDTPGWNSGERSADIDVSCADSPAVVYVLQARDLYGHQDSVELLAFITDLSEYHYENSDNIDACNLQIVVTRCADENQDELMEAGDELVKRLKEKVGNLDDIKVNPILYLDLEKQSPDELEHEISTLWDELSSTFNSIDPDELTRKPPSLQDMIPELMIGIDITKLAALFQILIELHLLTEIKFADPFTLSPRRLEPHSLAKREEMLERLLGSQTLFKALVPATLDPNARTLKYRALEIKALKNTWRFLSDDHPASSWLTTEFAPEVERALDAALNLCTIIEDHIGTISQTPSAAAIDITNQDIERSLNDAQTALRGLTIFVPLAQEVTRQLADHKAERYEDVQLITTLIILQRTRDLLRVELKRAL